VKLSRIRYAILLSMWFLGIALILSYINAIRCFEGGLYPEAIFWLGAILFSSSLACLWRYSKNHSYLVILIFASAFIVASIPFLRFHYHGSDLVDEYFVAQTTRDLGYWPIERFRPYTIAQPGRPIETDNISHQYFGCLSVTILPSMLSLVTGLTVLNIFNIMVPIASVLTVIGAFLVVRKSFGERIAIFASIVFFCHFIFGMFQELLRQDVALFFFFLTWYLLLKADRKFTFLAFITTFAMATAHYTLIYFVILWAFIMLISKRIHFRFTRRGLFDFKSTLRDQRWIFSNKSLLCIVAISLAWLLFVMPSMFSSNVISTKVAFQAMLGYAPYQYSSQTAHVIFSSLGLLHSVVKWIIAGLTIIGFLIALKVSRGRSAYAFTFWGGSTLLLTLMWVLIPNINLALNPDRIYCIGLLAFSLFIALSIASFEGKTKSWGMIFSTLIVVIMFVDSIGYPIYYTPASKLSSDTLQTFTPEYKICDFTFATWIQNHVNNNKLIAADDLGCRISIGFAQHICLVSWLNSTNVVLLTKSVGAEYFIITKFVDGYYIKLGPRGFFADPNDLGQFNRMYDNGRNSLLFLSLDN